MIIYYGGEDDVTRYIARKFFVVKSRFSLIMCGFENIIIAD